MATEREIEPPHAVQASRGHSLPEGGYRSEPASIFVHSAGAAVYLDIASAGANPALLALQADQVRALISALQCHLKQHAVNKVEVRHAIRNFPG